MSKEIGKISLKITVEDVKPSLLSAMFETTSKLIEWREIMAVHGYNDRVREIQKYIDAIVEVKYGPDN